MARWPPDSQEVIPDSEDEGELGNESPLTDIASSPLLPAAEMSLSQPQIAVLPEASEVPDPDRSPRNSPTSTSGVPALLLIKSSIPIDDNATTSAKPKPKPRPRPRPTITTADTTDQQADRSLLTDSISNPTPPPRIITSTSQPDSVAEFSSIPGLSYSKESDPVESYSQDIAERAKTRARASAVKPPAQISTIVEPEVIELSSDSDDELAFMPPKKSKGKEKEKIPRPPRKKAKTTRDIRSSNPANSTPSDPVFEADAVPDPPLPPSDPTLPSAHEDPTESHTGADPIDPLDSSPLPQPPRKRKRPQLKDNDDDDDQRQDPIEPPPFFAGSSSSAAMPSAPSEPLDPPSSTPQVKAVPKTNARKRKAVQSDDDADWDGDAKPAPKTKPKPRARKRKAARDDDDDVDPVPDAAPAPKRKRPAVRKKAEVVIEVTKPRSRTNTASNSPAKAKPDPPAPATPSPAKDSSSALNKGEEDDESSKDGPSTNSKPLQSRSRKKTGSKNPRRTSTNSKKVKGKNRVVIPSDDEGNEEETKVDDNVTPSKGKSKAAEPPTPSPQESEQSADKEQPSSSKGTSSRTAVYPNKHTPSFSAMRSPSVASTRGYILPRRDSRPMDEILRTVAAKTGSPHLANSRSALDKMTKSNFMKVVPLHRNRRTPPPPPPRPPPPKKTKKQLELEEKWEMELEESVDGWFCLSDAERSEHRHAKWNAERGCED